MNSYQKYFSACLLALLTQAALAAPSDFTILAGTAVTCTAGSITGDVGIANGTAATPFTNTGCAFAGTAHVNDQAAKDAYAAFVSAYAALTPKTTDVCPVITGTLAGKILAPGTYCVSAEAKTGVLTLDGTSNPSGTWTIKVPSGALTGTNFSVVMAGGGQACNVTWWVDAAATMTTSNLKGTLLTGADITVTGGTFIKGDAFAGGDGSTVTPSGAVTLTGATVVGCEAGSPGPGPGPDPRACSDRVTGGGYITVNKKNANFGVTGGIRNGKPRGHLTYIDHGTGLKVKGTGVTAYEEVDATTRFIAGTANINGVAGTYTVVVSDNGEPGKNKDKFAISLFDASGKLVYSASGTLAGGNIQLHKRHCDKGHEGHHGRDQGDDDDDDGDGDGDGDGDHGDKDRGHSPKPYGDDKKRD